MDGLRKKPARHSHAPHRLNTLTRDEADLDVHAVFDHVDSEGNHHSDKNPHQDRGSASVSAPPKTHSSKKSLGKKFLLIVSLIIVSLLGYGGFLLYKTDTASRAMHTDLGARGRVSQENTSLLAAIVPALTHDSVSLRGQDDGRINILLLGKAGKGHPGENLTDTIMIASIDTVHFKIGLFSLPRDLYVPVAGKKYNTKVNALYQRGLDAGIGPDLLIDTLEEITDQQIHYYFTADFDGFTKFVDTLGGVNVAVTREISDTRYPGPHYSYETFTLPRGLQVLDGATALKYARMRYDDPEGDFGRAKRQQKILQAIKNKMFTLRTLFNPLTMNALLDTLGDHMRTDITPAEMEALVTLSQKLDTQNINTAVADAWQKDSILRVSHIYLGGVRAFILVPRVGDFSEVQDLATHIFDLQKITQRTNAIIAEESTVLIVNDSGVPLLSTRIKELLTDLGFARERITAHASTVQNATSRAVRQETIVIDQTGDQNIFSLDEIVKRVPAMIERHRATDDIREAENYDIIIFLGTDIIDRHTYEQNSIDELRNADAFVNTDLFTKDTHQEEGE